MSDIVSRALSHPPVDTTYVAGRWHPGRASLQGVWTEARVLGASLTSPRNATVKKFLIISRARSGSTLLTRLLNAHPDVFCGRELLSRRVLFPRRYLNRLAHKSPDAAFGMKLLSYQMIQVQRLRDPVAFLSGLQADGFRFIHLERDTFAQTLSLFTAQTSRVYHQRDPGAAEGEGGKWGRHDAARLKERAPVEIDVEDFIRRLEWGDLLLDYERHCLERFPRLSVSYDRDLADEADHAPVAARAFDWIGVAPAPVPVASGMKKVLPPDPRDSIANYEALATRIREAGLERLLPG